MTTQIAVVKGVLGSALTLMAVAFGAARCESQALLVERLPGGAQLVLVNQPLADATTVVWPVPAGTETGGSAELIAGRLTLIADLEAALATADDDQPPPAPPVIVGVGGASSEELASLLERVLADRAPYPIDEPARVSLVEGGLDRRLGAPGSEAFLRLEVQMPPSGDWRRSSVEVLWDLVPKLVAEKVPFLQSRIEGEIGVLEGRVDAELAELTVSELRLDLARFASEPTLAADDVAEARRRLQVRRHAALEEHPDAAHRVLDRWLVGGEYAVREYVFGIQGVTLESVRDAASTWLPYHPGRAQLILPPRVFNPRFAVGPQTHRLANDLTAAVLERSAAPLSVICLRPVMVPDLDGEVTATVLARLARELRAADSRPGSIRVRTGPPLIELAGPADGFGELMEQLTAAYRVVIADDTPIASGGSGARRRALDLMAGVLGITEEGDASPATLLRPGNLALGIVAVDGEAAAEALGKFWPSVAAEHPTTDIQSLPVAPRTRIAAAGDESVVVVALDLAFGGLEAVTSVSRELLETRARGLWPDARVEVLAPYVPGRSLLLLVVASVATLDEVEADLQARWSRLVSPVDDEELTPVRRRVAARASAEMSGVSGHARRSAATAAGASRWHQPAEFELEILTVQPGFVDEVLQSFATLDGLQTTGAGVLPIGDTGGR